MTPSGDVELVHADETAEGLVLAAQLFREYADSLGFSLCFQGFEEELASLPGRYARPAGRLLLARVGDAWAGCAALRPLAPDIVELKRMYVRPAYRGRGVGRALAGELIAAARAIGCGAMRLDTLSTMDAANRLYDALGFREIAPYCPNPLPDARYRELDLKPHAERGGA